MHAYFDLPLPHLFGHRGACGEAPENTGVSFERAWAQGVGYLEMDCHATRDGEIVILHDSEVARTTNGEGPVSSLRFAELEKLDAGHRFSPDGETFPFRGRGVVVPRLAEVLERFPEARINLEIKQEEPAIAEAVVELIERAGATPRVLLAAEENRVLERVRALDPGTAIGSSFADVAAFYQALDEDRIEGFQPLGHALQIPPAALGRDLVTREALDAAHSLGLLVHVWTVNDADEMRRLLDLGVDGLMSDFPARLVAVAGREPAGAG